LVQVNPVEEPVKVGEKPLPEASTRMETIGKVMDGVFFVLSVVGLVLNIVSFKQAEAQLEKAIDDIHDQIVKAKETAKQLTADEASFFRDIPSFYLAIFSQIQRVVGIAGLAQIVQSPQVHTDKVAPILTQVNGYHPFSDVS
jgi:CII-binding regulator of phage lambda lysogenization HflD